MKRADYLTPDEFRSRWFGEHMPDIRQRHAAYLLGYRVNIRKLDADDLAGRPMEDLEWDGVTELWYRNAAALEAAYSGDDVRESRQDTLAHVARLQRLIVDQTTIIEPPI